MNMRSLFLPADAHYRLPASGRWRVHCRKGQLWITQAGEGRDHVLKAGSQQVFEVASDLLIGAMQDSELQVQRLQSWPLRNISAWPARLVLLLQRGRLSSFAVGGNIADTYHKESGPAAQRACPPFCEKLD